MVLSSKVEGCGLEHCILATCGECASWEAQRQRTGECENTLPHTAQPAADSSCGGKEMPDSEDEQIALLGR